MNFYKITSVVFTVFLLLTNCASSNSKEEFARPRYALELLDGDNKELYGCSLLIKITPWKYDDKWGNYWGRELSWRYNDGITQSERSEGFGDESRSVEIIKDSDYTLIYVGKWNHIKRLNKDIRVIGYQVTNKKRYVYEQVEHDFESRNSENEKIKEMPFKYAVTPTNTHKNNSECAIKWYDKYGYNAIVETKRVWARGFWGKLFLQHELDVTGKVVDSKE